MKYLILIILAAIAAFGFQLGLAHADNKNTILIQPTAVFAPVGFDNNDNVEITVDGTLKDSCLELFQIYSWVDSSKKVITIAVEVIKNENEYCADVLTPFTKNIQFGSLQAGTYEVRSVVKNEIRYMTSFPVSVAQSKNKDNQLYAEVTDLEYLGFNKSKNAAEILVKGNLPNTCMYFEKLKAEFNNSVVVILPILNTTGGKCQNLKRTFSRKVLVKNMPSGRFLVHARSLNGKSVNQIFDF